MEDNFRKVLCHLDVEDIKEILDEFEFPKSQKKDDLIELVLRNATVFEEAMDYLLGESTISEIRILCDDLGIYSKKILRNELEEKILNKLNKNIENRNIENKINFLSSPSDFFKYDLEDILGNYGMSSTGKREKLVKEIARNDFLVGKAMIEWKKELQKDDIKKMCESLKIDSEGNRENLLQRINDYVFENEVKIYIQNESPNKTNSSRNMDEIHSELRSIDDPSLMDNVVKEIELYRHPRKQNSEYPYQIGLHGWLSRTFPATAIESIRGSARPDIIIGNIAIEIKGPTHAKDLQTIADKISRYLNNFDKLIIVLFDIQVNPTYLNDYLTGRKLYKDEVNDRIKFIIK
jgi:hypothetical protein